MASANQHRAWAARNETFYRKIGGADSEWPDWALTILFYASVHEVSAFFAGQGLPVPKGHEPTKQALLSNTSWKALGQLYEQFQGQSNATRYRCYLPKKLEVQLAEQQLRMIREEIARLTN